MSTCIGYDALSGNECAREAVDEVVAGCVHEHVSVRPFCQYHMGDLAEERMICGDCHQGADSHRCVLIATSIRSRA